MTPERGGYENAHHPRTAARAQGRRPWHRRTEEERHRRADLPSTLDGVLRARFRTHLGGAPMEQLPGCRAAHRRPSRDRRRRRPPRAARTRESDAPLARRLGVVRRGDPDSARARARNRGAQRRPRSSGLGASRSPVLVARRRVRGKTRAAGGRAAGRRAGLARLRPASPTGRAVTAPGDVDPRPDRRRVARPAHLGVRGGFAADLPARDRRRDVLLHMAVHPHGRQRPSDASRARRRGDSRAAVHQVERVPRIGQDTLDAALHSRVVRRRDRPTRLRPATLASR